MLYGIIVAGFVVCAVQAIRSARLLVSALWLAGTSALVALLLYLLGATQVAVIELSVGAGLVTVLFVFAIGIAGEERTDLRAIVPKPLAGALVLLAALLLTALNLPLFGIAIPAAPGSESSFAQVMWKERGADVLVQIVLILAGVLGVLGLLGERPARAMVRGVPVSRSNVAPKEGHA